MVLNMEKNIDLERKNNNEIGQVLYAIWKNITESTTEKKKKFDKPYACLCTVFSCE